MCKPRQWLIALAGIEELEVLLSLTLRIVPGWQFELCWSWNAAKYAKFFCIESIYAWGRGLRFSVICLITFITTEQPWRRSVICLDFFKKDCHLVRRQWVSAYCNHFLQEKWHVSIRRPPEIWPLLTKHILEWTSGPRGYLMNTNLLATWKYFC